MHSCYVRLKGTVEYREGVNTNQTGTGTGTNAAMATGVGSEYGTTTPGYDTNPNTGTGLSDLTDVREALPGESHKDLFVPFNRTLLQCWPASHAVLTSCHVIVPVLVHRLVECRILCAWTRSAGILLPCCLHARLVNQVLLVSSPQCF